MPSSIDIDSQVHESSSSSSHNSSSEGDESISAPEFSSLTSLSVNSTNSEATDVDFLGVEKQYECTSAYPSFKIVGDNLDKYVKPRDMREDAQASILHFFNMYAVRNRLDTSQLSEDMPAIDLKSINVEKVLPSADDYSALTSNFAVLVCRILKKHMPFFSTFGSGVERHIQHSYSREMAMKSEVVSLTNEY